MHSIPNWPVIAEPHKSPHGLYPHVRISQLILLCIIAIVVGMGWVAPVVAQDDEPIPVTVDIAIETEDGEVVTASFALLVSNDDVELAGIEPSNGVTVTASVLTVQQTSQPTVKPQATTTPKPTVASSFSGAAGIVALDGPLKSEPDSSSSEVKRVAKGEQVIVMGQDARGSWFLLNDGSWVASDLVGNLGVEIPVVGSGSQPATGVVPTNNPGARSIPKPTNTPGPIPLDELRRNTESFIGKKVSYYGKVLQVLETDVWFSDKVIYTIRLAVDLSNAADNIIVLKIEDPDGKGQRLLEDDVITIQGIVDGRERFTTILGKQLVMPVIKVNEFELVE